MKHGKRKPRKIVRLLCKECPSYQPVKNKKQKFYCLIQDKFFRLTDKLPPSPDCPPTFIETTYKNLPKIRCGICNKLFRPPTPHIRYCGWHCRDSSFDDSWMPKIHQEDLHG